jgi:hypothetical protein
MLLIGSSARLGGCCWIRQLMFSRSDQGIGIAVGKLKVLARVSVLPDAHAKEPPD